MSIRMEVKPPRVLSRVCPERRGGEGRNRCRAAVGRRTTGFPLSLDNFFRQLERNCENSPRHIRHADTAARRFAAMAMAAGRAAPFFCPAK